MGSKVRQDKKNRVREAIEKVLDILTREDLRPIALAVFRGEGKPSDNWSISNRIIMLLHGTTDARGYRQWEKVGRHVKKGAKAFYILAPVIKKVPKVVEVEEERVSEDGEVIKEKVKKTIMVEKLVGFKAVPVFRKEDTYGEPLPEDKLKPEIPACFEPLLKKLGIKVRGVFFSGLYYGYYYPYGKEIGLASNEMIVFLHELAHAVMHRQGIELPERENEIVAELSAAVVAHLMGYKVPYGNVKEYLETYGGSVKAVYSLLSHVGRVVEFIVRETTDRESWYEKEDKKEEVNEEVAA